MCGIFAWAGKTPTRFRKEKLDILGIFNEKRGEHSCGITLDGDIHIGIDGNKIYKNFLSNVNYNLPKKYPLVIGHTRHATGGAHNIDNAHPFGYGTYDDGYEFVGVHNGSLHNHLDLAKDYEIETNVKVKRTENLNTFRDKIDSEILLEIIKKTKKYDVLEQYDGAAALIWSDLRNPNISYFYHGKSRKYDTDAAKPEEERPLFYWAETKNSLYISSLEESLKAIGAEDDEVFGFDYNTVYKVTNGDISKAETTKINRDTQIQTAVYRSKHHQNHHGHNVRGFVNDHRTARYDSAVEEYEKNRQAQLDLDEDVEDGYGWGSNCMRIPNSQRNRQLAVVKNEINIYNDETLLKQNEYGNKIYVNKLRYWRNGHRINGCYTWIKGWGFYFLGEQIKESEDNFYSLVNKHFHEGNFLGDLFGLTKVEKKATFIPFVHTPKREIVRPKIFYFFDGINIKSALDYTQCRQMVPPFTWDQLSICAVHPIMDISVKNKAADKQNIHFHGRVYTGTTCPMESEKIYEIVDGNCTKITPCGPNAKKTVKSLEEAVLTIEEIENVIHEEETKKSELSEDLLDKDMEEFFNDSLAKFPTFVKRLRKYNQTRAKNAVEIFEHFVEKATKLVSIDIND